MVVYKKDRKIVNDFIAYLSCGYRGLEVLYPEDINPGDIDAVAGQFAIEHTSVDTLPKQRQKSDWFMRAVGNLEKELEAIPYRLEIWFDYNAITKGLNWSKIRLSLKNWISHFAIYLPDGQHLIDNISGIPFFFRVIKASDRKPGVYFARFAPEDNSLPKRLRQQLDPKIKKITPYKEHDFTTILLLESDDIALMNKGIMLEAIQEAYPKGLPQNIDEIWFIDTSIPNNLWIWDLTQKIRRTCHSE